MLHVNFKANRGKKSILVFPTTLHISTKSAEILEDLLYDRCLKKYLSPNRRNERSAALENIFEKINAPWEIYFQISWFVSNIVFRKMTRVSSINFSLQKGSTEIKCFKIEEKLVENSINLLLQSR